MNFNDSKACCEGLSAGCSIENYVIRGKWGGGEAEGEVAAGEFILKVSPIIKLSNYSLQPVNALQG